MTLKDHRYIGSRNENRRDRLLSVLRSPNFLWLLLFFVGFGFFLIGMPGYHDDYWYRYHLREWFVAQGVMYPEDGGNVFAAGFPWKEIRITWYSHFMGDNIRLVNLFAPLLLIFPKWVGSGLMLIFWVMTVFASFRFAGVDWRRSPLVPVAMAAWLFFLPWSDRFGELDFQLNYIVPPFVGLWLAMMLRKREDAGLRDSLPVLPVAFLACACHEVVGVPMLAGIIFVAIFFRRRRGWAAYMAIAGIIAGGLLLLYSPGMQYRTSMVSPWSTVGVSFMQLEFVPVYLVWIGWLACVLFPKLRLKVKDRLPDLTLSAVVAVVAAFLSLKSQSYPRGMMLADILAVVSLMIMAERFFPEICLKYTLPTKILAVPLLCLVFTQQTIVAFYSLQIRKQQELMIESHLSRGRSSFFGQSPTLAHMPLIAGYMPESRYVIHSQMFYWYYLFYVDGKNPVVFPEELKYVDGKQGRLLNPDQNIREIEGYYYVPCRDIGNFELFEHDPIYCDFGRGEVKASAWLFRFMSEADGEDYMWILPEFDWYVSHFKQPRKIRIVDWWHESALIPKKREDFERHSPEGENDVKIDTDTWLWEKPE